MSYSAAINRANPALFLFVIDQSESMADPFESEDSIVKKCDGVANAMNRLLQNIAMRCARDEGVMNYFYIGVIGYGAKIGPSFQGLLTDKELVPISEIAISPLRVEERAKKIDDGAGGIVTQNVKFPVWFEPVAKNGTPMCKALNFAKTILEKWLVDHNNCYPPVVLHITDGESTDGDPRQAAEAIKNLTSTDGNVLLLNSHLSSNKTKSSAITFPDSEDTLPDQFAKTLFQMSSVMPEKMRAVAKELGFNVTDKARGYVFNGDIVTIIQWLDIGTSTATNLR